MMDLLAEMELSTQKLVQQEIQIKTMKNKIKKHLKDFSCEDASLKEEAASEPIRHSFEFSSSPRVDYSKL